MRLLLDTHFALWFAVQNEMLSRKERAILDAADFLVSAVSIWELRLKWTSFHVSGERKGTHSPGDVLTALNRADVELLPLLPAHAATMLQTMISHKDPFDELLLAQAQAEGLRLLTRDRILVQHPLAFIS